MSSSWCLAGCGVGGRGKGLDRLPGCCSVYWMEMTSLRKACDPEVILVCLRPLEPACLGSDQASTTQ